MFPNSSFSVLPLSLNTTHPFVTSVLSSLVRYDVSVIVLPVFVVTGIITCFMLRELIVNILSPVASV